MQATPFDSPPISKLLFRFLSVTIAWLLLIWGITGLLYPAFWLAKSHQFSSVVFDPDGWIQLYRDTAANLTSPPGICRSRLELRDVEVDLCRDFKALLVQREIMAFTPWGLLLGYLLLSGVLFRKFYRLVASHVLENKPKFVGKILGSLKSGKKLTFFERFYFLSPIQVELSNKTILIAYLGKESAKVKKGQSVRVYEIQTLLSGKRYLAVIDHPHVVVMRGAEN